MEAMARFVAEDLADRRGHALAVLDVGAMDVNGSYRQLFDDPAWSYTGLDAESGDGVDVVLPQPYDWSTLRNGSYDVIVSGAGLRTHRVPLGDHLGSRSCPPRGGLV